MSRFIEVKHGWINAECIDYIRIDRINDVSKLPTMWNVIYSMGPEEYVSRFKSPEEAQAEIDRVIGKVES